MKNKKKFIFLSIITIVILFLNIKYDVFIPCVFHLITNLYCPGCGVTRMLIALFHLDFYSAFRYNQLIFILLPFFIVLLINYIYSCIKKCKPLYLKINEKIWVFLIILLLIFGIVRNIFPYFAPIDV